MTPKELAQKLREVQDHILSSRLWRADLEPNPERIFWQEVAGQCADMLESMEAQINELLLMPPIEEIEAHDLRVRDIIKSTKQSEG